MKLGKPDYYDRFRCIAGACSDSCCIGWEIDIDEKKKEEYRETAGALGERLKQNIDWQEGHFILQGKEEKCPFLNEEHLCDLILTLGEDALCDICREHPRFYDWYEDYTEVGVGLCCEAAAGLILEREEPVQFFLGDGPKEEDGGWTQALFAARNTAFFILQNRTFSIWERLSLFLLYIEELQEMIELGALEEVRESADFYREQENWQKEKICDIRSADQLYRKLQKVCERLEIIDRSWQEKLERLDKITADEEKIQSSEREMDHLLSERDYEYEHIAVYFVYRYFMKCREDSDIYSKGCLAVFCVLLIRLSDILDFCEKGNLSKDDRIRNAKDCSKEIEYSEENLEQLAELFWNGQE